MPVKLNGIDKEYSFIVSPAPLVINIFDPSELNAIPRTSPPLAFKPPLGEKFFTKVSLDKSNGLESEYWKMCPPPALSRRKIFFPSLLKVIALKFGELSKVKLLLPWLTQVETS